MITVAEFAARLEVAIAKYEIRTRFGLEEIGKKGEESAKSYLGHYQANWAPLKPATIARKKRGDSPLLETEKHIHDTIKAEVDPVFLEMHLGSPDKIALFQEMGTHRGIPPRPFLSLAMRRNEPIAKEILGKVLVSLLLGVEYSWL